MSRTKREYDVFRGLINGEQVGTLDSETLLSCVAERVIQTLGSSQRVYFVLHDGCDTRKANSKEMEHLGQVLSLSKQVISGYSTMNSVVVNPDNQSVELLCHEVYSNKMPNYIGEATLKDAALVAGLSVEQAAMIKEKTFVNTKVVLFKNLRKSSELIKKLNPKNVVKHILDRGHDDEDTYREIDEELKDIFIVRAKSNRCSHELRPTFTPTGKPSKRVAYHKLIDKKFQKISQKELESHPIAIHLCELAFSKGKLSLHFILKGLEKLAHFEEVRNWIHEYNITEDQIQELLNHINTQNIKT